LNPFGAVYGRVADLRRQWYARHPERRRTLGVPVISVGNLVVGGSGKTPVTAALAQLLLNSGERPAILSRGYRRRTRPDDVVVVSDGVSVLTSVRESGDEPQMLARSLHGIPVVVCARRYRAGELAVSRFGSTVLVLDDGFQHLELARDADLLIVSPDDLHEQVLPGGSLREPLDAGRTADAVLVPSAAEAASSFGSAQDALSKVERARAPASRALDQAQRVANAIGVARAFAVEAQYGSARVVTGASEPFESRIPSFALRATEGKPNPGPRVIAVAGIARPHRFFEALRTLGWEVADQVVFPDHHWFDARDVARVENTARAAGAAAVMTTEKDATRLGDVNRTMPWFYVPLRVTLTPEDQFAAWIAGRLQVARERIRARSTAGR
jgi:tetraacyldisaccharide 4'-kinase